MRLYAIETGHFKLDGGAMFGVVPKTLWERTNPSDQNNRIDMAARSLLIEDGERLILIDTGLGNKQNEKFFSHYAFWGEDDLNSSLAKVGFHPDDITDVFLPTYTLIIVEELLYEIKKAFMSPPLKMHAFGHIKTIGNGRHNPMCAKKLLFFQKTFNPFKRVGN